ncbi:MAG: glycosyltransferase family 2 protein [Leptospiraceae bacterium]|nr:glycosyltransferase family 2 protein [Leptospiraceae bacterium]MDW7976107.1 glycosyltransferase family A protein [Leptospiraceae bacterium]
MSFSFEQRIPVSAIVIDHHIERISLLIDAIYSIQKNSFLPSEIIIILDVPEEEFFSYRNLIYRYKFLDFSYVRIYRNTRTKGPAGARNLAIEQSQYEWLAFLDSDDLWHKEKLYYQWKFLSKRPFLKACHTKEQWYKNQKFNPTPKRLEPGTGKFLVEAFRHCLISMSSIMIHKSVFEEIGYFDEELIAAEDYDFWIRYLVHYPIAIIPNIHRRSPTLKRSGGWAQTSQTKNIDVFRLYSLLKVYEHYFEKLDPWEKEELLKQIQYRYRIVQTQRQKYEFSEKTNKIYTKIQEKISRLMPMFVG